MTAHLATRLRKCAVIDRAYSKHDDVTTAALAAKNFL